MMIKTILPFALVAAGAADPVVLATFDGVPATSFRFRELNDPVMGGASVGTWQLSKEGKFGIFDGEVKNIPSLKVPGFIATAADGKFADASSVFKGDLVLSVRTKTPEFEGFRFSLASGSISPEFSCASGGQSPLARGCFKSKFSIPGGDDFTEVRIPLSSFSDKWSPATGEQTTTCAEDPSVCITADSLKTIQRLELWAEGKLGKVHVEIQSISADDGDRSMPLRVADPPSGGFNSCKMPIQKNLLYNISSLTEATVPVAVDDGETLAEAVCCDLRTADFAEPQFTYKDPNINFFAKLPTDGSVTTFYDSACGIPLFKAPINRTFAEFHSDTDEHGWPSFRTGEIIMENIIINKTNSQMTSVCGTHLGSYLPDEQGERYCMDLSCISGKPM